MGSATAVLTFFDHSYSLDGAVARRPPQQEIGWPNGRPPCTRTKIVNSSRWTPACGPTEPLRDSPRIHLATRAERTMTAVNK